MASGFPHRRYIWLSSDTDCPGSRGTRALHRCTLTFRVVTVEASDTSRYKYRGERSPRVSVTAAMDEN